MIRGTMFGWQEWQRLWEGERASHAAPQQPAHWSSLIDDRAYALLDAQGIAHDLYGNWVGLTGDEPARHQPLSGKLYPTHKELFHQHLDQLAEAKPGAIRMCKVQYAMPHPRSRKPCWRWLKVQMRALGEGVCVASFALIDDEIAQQRKLNTAHIEAELALRSRAEFLTHMSHELRTPLNAMLGFSAMMEAELHGTIAQPEYRDYLRYIQQSGDLLMERINDIMEVASIEVGNTTLADDKFTLTELLSRTEHWHAQTAFHRGVHIMLPRIVPNILLVCDLHKINRALGNLVSNAIRFSTAGSVVELRCILQESGLIIEIHDQGEGMRSEQLAHLRDAMAHESSLFSTKAHITSMGMGLAVAREFARLHDAHITLESTHNVGTIARLWLPAERILNLESPSKRKQRPAHEPIS